MICIYIYIRHLGVCIHIYIYICVFAYMCIYIYICIYHKFAAEPIPPPKLGFTSIYVCLYCIHVYIHTGPYMYMYAHCFVNVYECTCIHTFVYMNLDE